MSISNFIDVFRETDFGVLANLLAVVIATVGIMLTLVQLKLLRRQLKLDALMKVMDSNRQIVSLGFSNKKLWESFYVQADLLNKDEQESRKRYFQLWLNHMQIMWKSHQSGLFTRAEWTAYQADMGDFLKLPALREHWREAAIFYPQDFRKHINSLISSNSPAEVNKTIFSPITGKDKIPLQHSGTILVP